MLARLYVLEVRPNQSVVYLWGVHLYRDSWRICCWYRVGCISLEKIGQSISSNGLVPHHSDMNG